MHINSYMQVQYSYTIHKSSDSADHNPVVRAIYNAHRQLGNIVGASQEVLENGDIRQTLTFADSDAYIAWYTEIDAADTTPPPGLTYSSPTDPKIDK